MRQRGAEQSPLCCIAERTESDSTGALSHYMSSPEAGENGRQILEMLGGRTERMGCITDCRDAGKEGCK